MIPNTSANLHQSGYKRKVKLYAVTQSPDLNKIEESWQNLKRASQESISVLLNALKQHYVVEWSHVSEIKDS